MRALLLLVLGAGLVWFVWRGLGPGAPAETDAHASAPGAMIAMDPPAQPAASESSAGTPREPSAVPAEPPVAPPPVAAAAAPAVPADSRESSGTAPASVAAPTSAPLAPSVVAASPAEIAAAEELLRDPPGLGAWLATRGVDLPAGRREFAAGLVHAFAAQGAETASALDRAEKTGQVQPTERALAQRIAARGEAPGMLATESPLARAAAMKELERAALEDLAAGRAGEAAESLSRLLLGEIASPWRADAARLAAWSERLREAQRENRWNRRGKWRSTEIVVQPGDSLISVRKRAVAQDASLVVCTGQIARANQLEGEVIHPGAKLRIPLDPASVLVDLDAHWAFYLAGEEVVAAWPIGVGKESSATRVGTFTVGEKTKEPMWFPQGRKPVPFGDAENPLGTRWIAWNDTGGTPTRLGFHGTNEPQSIGQDASLGCIRMRTPDVEELYEILPRGASIRVVP
ncbi:MAG: L,D-transpeptidase family protein [Planctomycetota bacterium]|nr:L,D-transpeptidase family protein [Planctomycetota bacterium]